MMVKVFCGKGGWAAGHLAWRAPPALATCSTLPRVSSPVRSAVYHFHEGVLREKDHHAATVEDNGGWGRLDRGSGGSQRS